MHQHPTPSVRVLVLIMSEDDTSPFATLRAGARGYLLKESTADQIADASGASAAGRPSSANADPTGPARSGAEPAVRPFAQLTDREIDVLALTADGLDNAEIARRLGVAEETGHGVSGCASGAPYRPTRDAPTRGVRRTAKSAACLRSGMPPPPSRSSTCAPHRSMRPVASRQRGSARGSTDCRRVRARGSRQGTSQGAGGGRTRAERVETRRCASGVRLKRRDGIAPAYLRIGRVCHHKPLVATSWLDS